MKIVYVSTARIPDDWAHTLQVMKTCEALARAGAELELVVPRRHSTALGDPFAAMGVLPLFKLTRLRTLDLMRWHVPFSFTIMEFAFFLSLVRYLRRVRTDAVYVRGELVLPLAAFSSGRLPIFWETHERPGRMGLYRRAFARIRGVVTITEYYRHELMRDCGLAENETLCAPDAVDLAVFGASTSREEARARLGLAQDRTIAVYTGSNLAWKGVQSLRDAALILPSEYLVAFVGDIPPDGSDPRKHYTGFQPRGDMPLWLHAADALVLTGTASSTSSSRYTSPMKLFEYLAAERPIVAAELPSYREILDEKVAYFYTPDNPRSLADAIVKATEGPEAQDKAKHARELANNYSWDARGRRILAFIASLSTPRS